MADLTQLEELYDYAFAREIGIFDAHFSDTKKGACLCSDVADNIILDKAYIKHDREETEILAEEIGHIETGGIYRLTADTPIGRTNKLKSEYAAKVWRVKRLIPRDKLQEAIYQCFSMSELSECLGISLNVLNEAINYYERIDEGLHFPVREST